MFCTTMMEVSGLNLCVRAIRGLTIIKGSRTYASSLPDGVVEDESRVEPSGISTVQQARLITLTLQAAS